jgi:carbonic anhydrase
VALLSCSDSRVDPEDVFDLSAGNLFVVRVAGNVVDDDVLGSLENSVEQ